MSLVFVEKRVDRTGGFCYTDQAVAEGMPFEAARTLKTIQRRERSCPKPWRRRMAKTVRILRE